MNRYCPKCNSEFVLDDVMDRECSYPFITEIVYRYCECCNETTELKVIYKVFSEEILSEQERMMFKC